MRSHIDGEGLHWLADGTQAWRLTNGDGQHRDENRITLDEAVGTHADAHTMCPPLKIVRGALKVRDAETVALAAILKRLGLGSALPPPVNPDSITALNEVINRHDPEKKELRKVTHKPALSRRLLLHSSVLGTQRAHFFEKSDRAAIPDDGAAEQPGLMRGGSIPRRMVQQGSMRNYFSKRRSDQDARKIEVAKRSLTSGRRRPHAN